MSISDDFDVAQMREAFAGFPCGVVTVAAVVDGEPTVLVASSFAVGVSQDPPLVMFAVQDSSTTWPTLSTAATLGVSVLGEQHADKVRQLAARDKSERFVNVTTQLTELGAILLDGAPVWLETMIEHSYPAGDHRIVVLKVIRIKVHGDHTPLVWHRSGFARLAC